MRRRLLTTVALVVALAAAAPATADHLPPRSIRLLPKSSGSPSTLAVNASFDQPPGAELQAYDVDIARGFRFDPRAVAGRCTPSQARASTCPASSRIGAGQGQVHVTGPGVPGSDFTLDIAFYVMRPQQHGDIAGLVLAGREPQSGLHFALLGRMIRLAHGRYGLELRFDHTAGELPSGYTVQLQRVHVRIGARRVSHGVHYNLLVNPPSCSRGTWPFLLTVAYSSGTERYSAAGACTRR